MPTSTTDHRTNDHWPKLAHSHVPCTNTFQRVTNREAPTQIVNYPDRKVQVQYHILYLYFCGTQPQFEHE